MSVCDCERSHNGLGMSGRECDCGEWETPVPPEAPVMKAWEQYKATEGYANTRMWAHHEDHVDGSLWAAFYAGFFACAVNAAGPAADAATEIEQLRAALQHFIEVTPEPPEASCWCHISPPCNDCVDNAGLREAFAEARKLLGAS